MSQKWLAINIKRSEVMRAEKNLNNQGYKCYFPALYSCLQSKQKKLVKKESMFPGYAFLQLHANIELKPIESTRGVI